VIEPPSSATTIDSLHPPLGAALESLAKFEWVGLTDLFEPSLCLLHYQANRTLPAECVCDSASRRGHRTPLGNWVETRSKWRDPNSLSPETLARIDAHTDVDAQLFAAALRLFLGRLRTVEAQTGSSVLACIDWAKLKSSTSYIAGLWAGAPDSLLDE
jgi:hypothetical protein